MEEGWGEAMGGMMGWGLKPARVFEEGGCGTTSYGIYMQINNNKLLNCNPTGLHSYNMKNKDYRAKNHNYWSRILSLGLPNNRICDRLQGIQQHREAWSHTPSPPTQILPSGRVPPINSKRICQALITNCAKNNHSSMFGQSVIA